MRVYGHKSRPPNVTAKGRQFLAASRLLGLGSCRLGAAWKASRRRHLVARMQVCAARRG